MLKYVNTGVVFQEIPDEVTLAINISNCPCRCPGCLSSYLWGDIGTLLTENAIDTMIGEYGNEITCICFMGGDADPYNVARLADYITEFHPAYKVGWYSGRTMLPTNDIRKKFNYIKVGPYIKHLGSLKERTTNQRLYKKNDDGSFMDITSRFWRQNT